MAALRNNTSDTTFPALHNSSDQDSKIFCYPCDQLKLRLPAIGFCLVCKQHLCKPCFNHHKRTKPLMYHSLLDEKNMPKTIPSHSKPTTIGQNNDPMITPCLKHKNEKVQYYCKDHEELLCSVCITLDHTCSPRQVNYIPDISEQALKSEETSNTLQTIQRVMDKCQQMIKDTNERISASNKSLAHVLAEIKKFRQEINQRLDDLEKEAEDQVNIIVQDNKSCLKKTTTSCENLATTLSQSSDKIKQLYNSKQAENLFINLKAAKKLVNDSKQALSQLTSPTDINDYYFQPNTIISGIFREEKLSEIKCVCHHDNIIAGTSNDAFPCFITGMTLLNTFRLILTDNANSSIKMVDINSNSIIDELQLNTSPWDVTKVTNEQMAVTLQYNETIQFVSASSKKLSLKQKLKVDGKCYGISCYRDRLAVTLRFPAKLQILNLKGKVLSTTDKNSDGEIVFIKPLYIASNSHSIYISDERKKSVVRLNWQGEVLSSFHSLCFNLPNGIAILKDETLLICDSGNILRVCDDLKKSHVVLKNVKYLGAACCCDMGSTFFTSHSSKISMLANIIHVYKL